MTILNDQTHLWTPEVRENLQLDQNIVLGPGQAYHGHERVLGLGYVLRHLEVCLQLMELPGVLQGGDQAVQIRAEYCQSVSSVLPDRKPRGLTRIL